jgi:hypothetical protein
MTNYLNANKMMKLSLAEIEKTLDAYLKMAESMDWDITEDFEQDLRMLTLLAKQKGSTRRW